ncbi:hypothetical protein [Plantactinospora sp. B5E13]|uniref:hypothetical protein n=1 Tax=unclassified Plantactinospora TaxID=2631981 RepID=UPI00325E5143
MRSRHRLSRVPATLLVTLVVAGLVTLGPAGPAAARDGKLRLAVAGDGATGVTVQLSYADTGDPVETGLRLVLRATGEGGRQVGPLQLGPAGEGRGFYSSGPILTPGRWEVSVRAPEPDPAEATVVVQARAPQSAPAVVADAPKRSEADSGGSTRNRWLVGAGVVTMLALATLGVLGLRARRFPADGG